MTVAFMTSGPTAIMIHGHGAVGAPPSDGINKLVDLQPYRVAHRPNPGGAEMTRIEPMWLSHAHPGVYSPLPEGAVSHESVSDGFTGDKCCSYLNRDSE